MTEHSFKVSRTASGRTPLCSCGWVGDEQQTLEAAKLEHARHLVCLALVRGLEMEEQLRQLVVPEKKEDEE